MMFFAQLAGDHLAVGCEGALDDTIHYKHGAKHFPLNPCVTPDSCSFCTNLFESPNDQIMTVFALDLF